MTTQDRTSTAPPGTTSSGLDPWAHNLPDMRSPLLGRLAVIVSMMLNVTAVVASVPMPAHWLRLRTAERG